MNIKLDLCMEDVNTSLNFFKFLKKECDGMMSQALYKRMFELAKSLPAGNIVEIGTASGASAIAAALGLEASGNPGKVYTFDKHERGSRQKFPSSEASLAAATRNIASFGMGGKIDVAIANAEEIVSSLDIGNVQMMIIDADGRIYRDLATWGARMPDHSIVIIDDCEDKVRFRCDRSGRWTACFKKRMTWLIFQRLVEARLLEHMEYLDGASISKFHSSRVSDKLAEEAGLILKEVKGFSISGKNVSITYDKTRENDDLIIDLLSGNRRSSFQKIAIACDMQNLKFDLDDLAGFSIEKSK